jgi:hypothetical protein
VPGKLKVEGMEQVAVGQAVQSLSAFNSWRGRRAYVVGGANLKLGGGDAGVLDPTHRDSAEPQLCDTQGIADDCFNAILWGWTQIAALGVRRSQVHAFVVDDPRLRSVLEEGSSIRGELHEFFVAEVISSRHLPDAESTPASDEP